MEANENINGKQAPKANSYLAKPTITISIKTTDLRGNEIYNHEKYVFDEMVNPQIDEYVKLFLNCLSKQEFSKNEIQKALHDVFIETDQADISK